MLVTTTFAYALLLLAGVGIAVSIVGAASVTADLLRRKSIAKVVFNASQYTLSLGAGGLVYSALGGNTAISARTLPAVAAGGLIFLTVNHVLVTTVVSLAARAPVLPGMVQDLRIEFASSMMTLALAPVAVVAAERSVLLVPALALPLVAVYATSKREVEAQERRAEAEAAAERQRRLAEREQEVVRRLQEADRMKADLLATVTHELRSPLTTILGALQLLHNREGRIGSIQRLDLVNMGLRQGERLHRMIEQLLLAARFEQQSPETVMATADRVELDAAELARQAGAEAEARHRERPIKVEADEPLPVRVVHDAVVQVLGNLIDNACKYSSDGEPISLSASRQGSQAVLAVEDSGPGIPAADRERVFERFTQLEEQSDQREGGVGLGLYIARQLARSQGGDLIVTDGLATPGARFELRLPLLPREG